LIEGPSSAYDIANRKMIFNAHITLNIREKAGNRVRKQSASERGFMMSKSSKNALKLSKKPLHGKIS